MFNIKQYNNNNNNTYIALIRMRSKRLYDGVTLLGVTFQSNCKFSEHFKAKLCEAITNACL